MYIPGTFFFYAASKTTNEQRPVVYVTQELRFQLKKDHRHFLSRAGTRARCIHPLPDHFITALHSFPDLGVKKLPS